MKLRRIFYIAASAAISASLLLGTAACGKKTAPADEVIDYTDTDPAVTDATPTNTHEYNVPQDYCRTYYEIFVRSFADGDGDGIGDFKGLTANLDYLNDGNDATTADLGINGIWLMPINAAASYHKYDVVDYFNVDSEYGTLEDFDKLVEECNKRNIWIQMDLVLNHTSNQHPDFVQAVSDAQHGKTPETSEAMAKYCFYRAEERPKSGKYAQVLNSEYYYLCNFDTGMPDVNLQNDAVRENIKDIVDFWLERGVHSFRLDAVPWACANDVIYNDANGEFWSWFNNYCDQKGAEVFGSEGDGISRYCYNVGEVLLTGDSATILKFFRTGMSAFNYTMGGNPSNGFAKAVLGTGSDSGASLVNSLVNMQGKVLECDTYGLLSNFLSGHDNDRSAGFFESDPIKIKKAAGLYLLAPGNPYIYYGEEIGALGSGKDPNKRMPFNWGDKRGILENPPGVTFTGTQKLGTWKSQTNDPDSILTYYRNAIAIRNRFPEIGRGLMRGYAINSSGRLVEIDSAKGSESSFYAANALNKSVAAYTLTWENQTVLIVHNIGEEGVCFDAPDFADMSVVAKLKTAPGRVEFSGGKLILAAGTTAVLKKV